MGIHNRIIDTLFFIYDNIGRVPIAIKRRSIIKQMGYIGKNVVVGIPDVAVGLNNVFLHDNTHVYSHSKFIIGKGKFTMMKNSGAAQGFTVITGEHPSFVGKWIFDNSDKVRIEKDVLVCEDVLIGANVTLLAGVTVGRGANIGANSVVRSNIPPYAVVLGNPAKIIGFRFAPDEVIQHEKQLYPENERIDSKIIQKNYEKYYFKRMDKIRDYLF